MKVNPLIVFREDFEQTAVLFNPDDGQVMGLNQTGAFVWKRLEKNKNLLEIVAELKEACDGDCPDDVDADVLAFVADLKEKGFLLPDEA